MKSYRTNRPRPGDHGCTYLLNGKPIPKTDARVHALGDLDELSCFLGVIRCTLRSRVWRERVKQLQEKVSVICAEIAMLPHAKRRQARPSEPADVQQLETWCSALATSNTLRRFVLPGESPSSVWIDVARTVARRAERSVAAVARNYKRHAWTALAWLNRLSDLLWLLARHVEKTHKK